MLVLVQKFQFPTATVPIFDLSLNMGHMVLAVPPKNSKRNAGEIGFLLIISSFRPRRR